MVRQTFVVTLEVPSPDDRCFPRVEAEWMASNIRDAIEAKSVSFTGPTPFAIKVERTDETASASGRMREYSPEMFEEDEELSQKAVKAVETVPALRSS